MVYAHTSHNRTVYATPPVGGLASVRLGHSATLHSHASLQHSLPALVLFRKPLFGLANCHIQPERYVTYNKTLYEKIYIKTT
jgi:hypothetical protein